METEIKIVRGPSSTRLTKEAAATELENMPGFPKEATYSIEDIDGRWIAAINVPKVAGPFDGPPGPPTDGPPPGPPGGEGEEDEGGPPDEKPKEDKDGDPSSEGAPKEDGKLSVEHQLANLTDMLTKITDALGLSSPADGMIPGADDGGAVPPPGGPEGLPPEGGPPGAGAGPPGVEKKHLVHERSLKPTEAPPGTTPVGSPSFSSVQVEEGHPWKAPIEAGSKEFEVESDVGDSSLSNVAAELKSLAEPYGYIVTDLAPSGVGTARTASARIVRTR